MEYTDLSKVPKMWIYIVLTLIGVLLIVCSFCLDQSTLFSKALLPVGSALIGTSITFIISKYVDHASLLELIGSTRKLPQVTSGRQLENYKGKYHCYYISKSSKSDLSWRYYCADYSKGINSYDHMFAEIKIVNDDKEKFIYNDMSLLFRDTLMKITMKDNGSENPAIYLVPKFTEGYTSIKVGIGQLKAWNGELIIAPIVISKKPIANWTKEGKVTDETLSSRLWSIVDENLPKNYLSSQIKAEG